MDQCSFSLTVQSDSLMDDNLDIYQAKDQDEGQRRGPTSRSISWTLRTRLQRASWLAASRRSLNLLELRCGENSMLTDEVRNGGGRAERAGQWLRYQESRELRGQGPHCTLDRRPQ